MLDILGLSAIGILIVVGVALELGLEPRDPKWRRWWRWFSAGVMGLFVIWMIILFGFLK